MKKIFNYLIFKMSSYKIITMLGIVYIYQFFLFIKFIRGNTQYNFYDLAINKFSYLNLFYFFSLFFIIILYNLCENTNFYRYLFLRFGNKFKVYNTNVLIIFLSAITFNLFINLATLLESVGNVSFRNQWSINFFEIMNGVGKINLSYSGENISIITKKLTPLAYVIHINILVILYLFLLGLIFLVSNLLFKKRAISFIIIILLIRINVYIDSINGFLSKLSFTSNIFFITAPYAEIENSTYSILRLIYWSVSIFIVYFIGLVLTKKLDYKFGD